MSKIDARNENLNATALGAMSITINAPHLKRGVSSVSTRLHWSETSKPFLQAIV
jgi:hypothetical protein